MSAEEAQAARAGIARSEPEMMWLPAVGLDRHTPLIGLRPLPTLGSARSSEHGREKRIDEAIYRPISDLHKR
jgi:hypothetical protein